MGSHAHCPRSGRRRRDEPAAGLGIERAGDPTCRADRDRRDRRHRIDAERARQDRAVEHMQPVVLRARVRRGVADRTEAVYATARLGVSLPVRTPAHAR
jgi:hypothetical protein